MVMYYFKLLFTSTYTYFAAIYLIFNWLYVLAQFHRISYRNIVPVLPACPFTPRNPKDALITQI